MNANNSCAIEQDSRFYGTLCDFSKLFAGCVFGNFPSAHGWLAVWPDAGYQI